MSDRFARLAQDRKVRDAAHAVFRADLERVRRDLAARGIAGRIADKAGEEAREAVDSALTVAVEHKGVVAGTLAALLLWILRNPLIEAIGHLFGHDEDREDAD